MTLGRLTVLLASLVSMFAGAVLAQGPSQPDWPKVEEEIMRHFQAVLRFDTRNPPGNEHLVAEYLKQVFDKEGIPAQTFALDSNRSNVVARLKGSGRKRPILIMGHSDVVTVDEAKWKFPPFSATRDGG
jgi:acetylornithine deacetylase/succinyl-diaminopimelate desuccinylase-like protein